MTSLYKFIYNTKIKVEKIILISGLHMQNKPFYHRILTFYDKDQINQNKQNPTEKCN
jgi:hypothetical protein